MSEQDGVPGAVERARAAGPAWSGLSVRDRVRHLEAVREVMLDRVDELVDLICEETGKTPTEALFSEIAVTAELIAHYARRAPRVLAPRRVPTGIFKTKRARVAYEPYGVVGVISPWNYPFTLTMGPVVTALAAGNTVVLKPSEVTPRVGRAAGRLFADAGAHPDLVQVVTGDGSVGAALVTGGVDKVAFTGSVATGRRVMEAASKGPIPVVLELGGKDPLVVCDDADVERAAGAAVWGAFFNAGQTCISIERVYATGAVYEELVERIVEGARGVEVGRDIGTMTFPPQVDVVERHVADAVDKGARVLVGGGRVPGGGPLHLQPTVLVDVDHSMSVMREETFGPVLPVMRVDSEEEAVRLANETRYGLDAAVFTASRERAERMTAALETGSVCLNDVLVNYALPGLPFGGSKDSGFGRAHGDEGLLELSRTKSVAADRTGARREPHWFLPPRRRGAITRMVLLRHRRRLRDRLRGLVLGR